MPVPSTIGSLSTTASSNSPAGSESVFPDLDGHLRAGYSFIAQLHAGTTKPSWSAAGRIPYFDAFGNYGSSTALARDTSGNVSIGDGSTPLSGRLQLQLDSTAAGPDFVFGNRGTGASHTNSYRLGGLFGAGYRDVSNPAYVAAVTIERTSNNGGLSSFGTVVIRTSANGEASKDDLPQRVAFDGNGNIAISNTFSAPSAVTGIGYLYVEDGALKFRGSSGTLTVIAPA